MLPVTLNYITSVCTCREKVQKKSGCHTGQGDRKEYNPFPKQYTLLLSRGPADSLPLGGSEEPCSARPDPTICIILHKMKGFLGTGTLSSFSRALLVKH